MQRQIATAKNRIANGEVKSAVEGGVRLSKQALHYHTQSRRELSALLKSNEKPVVAVANALSVARRDGFAADERKAFEAIDALRTRLNSAHDPFEVTIYFDSGEGMTKEWTLAEAPKIPNRQGKRLCKLAREFGATSMLEMGTSVGMSAAYLSTAATLNAADASIVTIEGSETMAEIARSNLDELGYGGVATVVQGRFQDVLDDVCRTHGPFDLAFVDGHHEGEATKRYLERIDYAAEYPSMVILDDIFWSEDMTEAWRDIRNDDRVGLSVEFSRAGLLVLSDEFDAGDYSIYTSPV